MGTHFNDKVKSQVLRFRIRLFLQTFIWIRKSVSKDINVLSFNRDRHNNYSELVVHHSL